MKSGYAWITIKHIIADTIMCGYAVHDKKRAVADNFIQDPRKAVVEHFIQ